MQITLSIIFFSFALAVRNYYLFIYFSLLHWRAGWNRAGLLAGLDRAGLGDSGGGGGTFLS